MTTVTAEEPTLIESLIEIVLAQNEVIEKLADRVEKLNTRVNVLETSGARRGW